jgi:HAD superfamily hydrolase (TIGR01509 family)
MRMTAILFGSIGTLADTSELQREAFNAAFAEHGLDWEWTQQEYQSLLSESGGAGRIATYAQARGADVDADAVHATKSEIFQRRLREGGIEPRPEVAATIETARSQGVKIALVTTTSADNIAALKEALAPTVDLDSFDLILDTSDADEPKPAKDIYAVALQRLGENATDVLVIEDNVGGVTAAVSAGLNCIAFPGENNADHDFSAAERRVDTLTTSDMPILTGSQS